MSHPTTSAQSRIDTRMARAELERREDWGTIIDNITNAPALKFRPDWDVYVIPPFCGAVARFTVRKGARDCSVYLDCHDQLGWVGRPYYEMYDGEDTQRFYLDETDELMAAIAAHLDEVQA